MKPILVDSSVLLDIFTNDPVWARRSVDAVVSWSASCELSVNDAVVAEVSVGFSRIEDLREALGAVVVRHIPMPMDALFLAGKAFVAYRRRGGNKAQSLPHFFIGAHAAVAGIPLLTRDPARIRTNFPGVQIHSPG